ncbi:NADH:ubiquinone oxidoreductase subunit 5 (chain L)/Multisubunit Na+/H+ antiporter, MnhA subunit [hydrothermal vent metagenome]|uniref:NADH:ubiquinone oxidoreductase subunit 5 (Chain L)/Multisubunit Na+/H+ antiporter, MnhA subunit n=2 Tax=hydrothermal vent metagenome TaxID=652676 RepID=A0A3B1D542_9ZZZZ
MLPPVKNKNYKHSEITDKIIKAYYTVYNKLGYGFLEKVYENSMLIELKAMGLKCSNQFPIKVNYNGKQVGEYFADIIVENCVIVELKASETLAPEHEVQLLNYLKATDYEVGLLLNFGAKPQVKRRVYDLKYK